MSYQDRPTHELPRPTVSYQDQMEAQLVDSIIIRRKNTQVVDSIIIRRKEAQLVDSIIIRRTKTQLDERIIMRLS